MTTTELDRIDLKILDLLQKNGRATNLEIAKLTKLSPAQATRRHRRLEEIGVIKGYQARLMPTTLGLTVIAFIHISMDKNKMQDPVKFKASFQALPEIQECYAVTGDFDYILKIITTDLKTLSLFLINKLMKIPGVNNVRSSVCLDEIKSTSTLPLS